MCNNHPKYRAIRKPRVDCPICWLSFLSEHRDKPVNGDVLFHVLEMIFKRIWEQESDARSAGAMAQCALDVANGLYG